jgi:DNA helicase-2/ATP-dependent DNA helicase PcrA
MRRMFGRAMPAEPSLFLTEIDPKALRILGNAPYGFAGRKASGKGQDRAGPARSGGEGLEAGGWRRGDRLYHDDNGYGEVVDVRNGEDGPVVRVIFETGKELRFLAEHQGSRFTRIGKD